MIVKFWGVRGSYPISDARALKYGGNTSCVSVQIDNKLLVIDAGSGVRILGDALGDEVTDIYFILTHLHRDHLDGFPFFGPLYKPGRRVHLIDYRRGKKTWSLISMLDGIHYPMRPSAVVAEYEQIKRRPMKYLRSEGFGISRLKLNHPGGAYGYRVEHEGKVMVHIPDNELAPKNPVTSFEQFVTFCTGADLLSHDAMYVAKDMPEKRGWGHSTVLQACKLARESSVGHLALFHHAPERMDDAIDAIQDEAQDVLKDAGVNCTAAYEGLTFRL
ncbi:MAG: MBL fold metallo-hydrolase [Bacteroidota bacterium]